MSYGVSRGVDFDGVSFILNFDFPQSLQSYEHRVGRTARNKLYGTALSFVLDPTAKLNHYKEFELLREIQSKQPMLTDDAAVANIESLITPYDPNAHTDEFDVGRQPKKLSLNMAELDGFRYRVEDTMRAVTNNAVSEFRAAELKREIMNSEGLKEYFQQNPDDFKVLHHDKTMAHPIRRKSHLGNIPSYLVPASMRTLPVAERKGKKRSRGSGNYLKKKLHDVKVSDPLSDTALLGVSHDQRRLSLQMNESTSNRKKWKQAHRKGEYSKGKKNKRKES
jgi:ATP-dependent RNA helicase DDX56/DBP9